MTIHFHAWKFPPVRGNVVPCFEHASARLKPSSPESVVDLGPEEVPCFTVVIKVPRTLVVFIELDRYFGSIRQLDLDPFLVLVENQGDYSILQLVIKDFLRNARFSIEDVILGSTVLVVGKAAPA